MGKEILEGNKLIAEFMGYKFNAYPELRHHNITRPGYNDWFYASMELEEFNHELLNILQYHKSWNEIMPVIDKIMDIDITPAPQWTGYRMEIVPRGYVKISGFPMHTITTNVSIEGSLIKAVWKAVVQFIHFYNTQSKVNP